MTSNSSSNDAPNSSDPTQPSVSWPVDLPLPGPGRYPRLKSDSVMQPWDELVQVDVGSKVLTFPPGLTLVVGKTGAGKTRTVQALVDAAEGKLEYINLLEPFNQGDEINATPVTYSIEEAMGFASLVLDSGHVPVLDSLRVLTYISSGATGKRGINMGMFGYLTALNNRLAQLRCSMVALINPLLDEADDYNAFLENCLSSVVGVIEISEPGAFKARQRPDRDRAVNFHLAMPSARPQQRAQTEGPAVKVKADFPASLSTRATRSKVTQLQATPTGSVLKGRVDLLN